MATKRHYRNKSKKTQNSVTKLFRMIFILLILVLVLAYLSFRGWNETINSGLEIDNQVIETSMGPIQFKQIGTGPIILLSHMAGSGFDNADLVKDLSESGYQVICSSRPGYLNTPINDNAGFSYQAELFAELLHYLKIEEKIFLLGISTGGPAAIEFASKYPNKCHGIILYNSPGVKIDSTDQLINFMRLTKIPFLDQKSDIENWVIHLMSKYNPRKLMRSILEKGSTYSPDEINSQLGDIGDSETWKKQLINYSNILSPRGQRFAGFNNDLRFLSDYKLSKSKIRVPALIVHSKVDKVIDFSNAELISKTFVRSKLYSFNGFGHAFWLGPEWPQIMAKTKEFLSNNTPKNGNQTKPGSKELSKNTWVNKSDGAILQIMNSEEFSLDFPSVDEKRNYNGRVAIVDNQISFTYDDVSGSCPGVDGIYQFEIIDDNLNLKPINDNCKSRRTHFSEGWFKI
ncbi:MAG: alpha/beta hydrolase [Bacteroidetes bacterium]|nr:alpha/beta hydrolase [Bacteroidota bacterium]